MGVCDICGREAVCNLISSGCAPVSYAACSECIDRRAENIDVAALWVHMRGGAAILGDHTANLVAWEDGSYVSFPEILSFYESNKDAIIAGLGEEYDLVDLPLDPEV